MAQGILAAARRSRPGGSQEIPGPADHVVDDDDAQLQVVEQRVLTSYRPRVEQSPAVPPALPKPRSRRHAAVAAPLRRPPPGDVEQPASLDGDPSVHAPERLHEQHPVAQLAHLGEHVVRRPDEVVAATSVGQPGEIRLPVRPPVALCGPHRRTTEQVGVPAVDPPAGLVHGQEQAEILRLREADGRGGQERRESHDQRDAYRLVGAEGGEPDRVTEDDERGREGGGVQRQEAYDPEGVGQRRHHAPQPTGIRYLRVDEDRDQC